MTCIGEPISWLRLEQYQLGQLPQSDRAGIAEHLVACGACRACLDAIKADVRDLPALPPNVIAFRRKILPIVALASAACLAAVIAAGLSGPTTHVKGGGTVAFTLTRSDGAEVTKDGIFRDGDAFKAFATCAPQSKWYFDLVVYDAGGASFPVSAPGELACGNLAPIQGAFHFTGHDDETVCLVWGERAPDRGALRKGLEALGPNRDCKTLKPAR